MAFNISPLNPHYSFESIPTAYDEEALTTLELCGRLGKKVNEVITAVNGWEMPIIVNVSPTGDKTGELDRVVIQGKLDAGYAVQLSAGEYYLNNPLMFRAGYMLKGDSQLNTVLNCKAGFIDHDGSVSVDHVEVRDIRVKGPNEGTGIDISRKSSGLETGGRYAHFMNVYISGYDTAVRLGGCWCTNFTHCRIEASELCVEQRGSCNHIKYDHCMFLGPVNEKTSTAVKITAEDGAENYGITFDHCEFERHKYAIHAYYCVALNVHSVYAEGVDTVFQLDSCPSFLCDGGYISYPRIVLQGGKTNSNSLFSKSGGALRDIFVRVNSNDKWPLMSTPDVYPVRTENITVQNDGEGVCYANAQHYTSIYNGNTFMDAITMTKLSKQLHGTEDMYEPITHYAKDKQFKIIRFRLEILSNFTQTGSPAVVNIFVGGKKYLTATVPTGEHKAGDNIYATVNPDFNNDYGELIFSALDNVRINIASAFSGDPYVHMYLDIVNGDFIL